VKRSRRIGTSPCRNLSSAATGCSSAIPSSQPTRRWPGGPVVEDTGWGLVIYHHDADGKWRVARGAWGPDHALPAR